MPALFPDKLWAALVEVCATGKMGTLLFTGMGRVEGSIRRCGNVGLIASDGAVEFPDLAYLTSRVRVMGTAHAVKSLFVATRVLLARYKHARPST